MKNAIYQLASTTGRQMESYILTTSEGKVIVVDGGFREDADNMLTQLRAITGKDVPHVDAWFLTHAHEDHILCLCALVKSRWSELSVDRIYYNFPSVQFLCREKGYCGSIHDFKEILPIIADKIETVYGGDVYDVGEAHIEVLYSPNCEIDAPIVNNSSVVLAFTLGGKRILFLGDASVAEGERLLARYAGTGKLRADMVQMAHHGQGGVELDVYREIAPSACFWGAPEWLWNNDAGGGYNTHFFKTITVREWMDSLGVRTHYVLKDGMHCVEL